MCDQLNISVYLATDFFIDPSVIDDYQMQKHSVTLYTWISLFVLCGYFTRINCRLVRFNHFCAPPTESILLSGCPLSVSKQYAISHHLVVGIQWNSPQISNTWVCIAVKVFKVIGAEGQGHRAKVIGNLVHLITAESPKTFEPKRGFERGPHYSQQTKNRLSLWWVQRTRSHECSPAAAYDIHFFLILAFLTLIVTFYCSAPMFLR